MKNDGGWGVYFDNYSEIKYPLICKYNPHYQDIIDRHDYRGELKPCEHYHGHGSSWQEVGEYCIKGHSTKVQWSVAEHNCNIESTPSHLVSIHNKQENIEVMHQMAKCMTYTIRII